MKGTRMDHPLPFSLTGARRVRWGLLILAGVMLGLSFPPSPLGILACFGLVPLLIVLADEPSLRRGLQYSYVTFLVFHLLTLNWTGGYAHAKDPYMMLAGAVTMLAHPLFYFLPIGAYQAVKKHLGEKGALVALPFLWVAYEYTHSLSEWSFPWLTIGNSQTYDISRIQFIEFTGVYGLSFWIVVVNVVAFTLYSLLAGGHIRPRSVRAAAWLALLVVVYELPLVHGLFTLASAERGDHARADSITVGIVQANIDPWEKWSGNSTQQPVQLQVRMTEQLCARRDVPRPELVLWPETAIPYYVFLPLRGGELAPVREVARRMGLAVMTGLPVGIVYEDSTSAPPSARRLRWTGQRYDAYNAAALVDPLNDSLPWYGKMKMVPLAERVPYADLFAFLDFLRWGVGIGGWQIGKDTTIFVERKTGAKFSTMICYESVYPGFVAGFVRKGAEFITILTIDSWWDGMSGAYQHQQFAILRAIENRRWIARCAAGGFSCFVDPWGRVHDRTALFTQATLSHTIERFTEQTWYTRHGDWLGVLCVMLSGFFLAAVAGMNFTKKVRSQ